MHLRYLGGGRTQGRVSHERLFRFEFPEKPGALEHFLDALQGMPGGSDREEWQPFNVSLFHYQNIGSDYGTVLAGIQIEPEREEEFDLFLEHLGYVVVDESENPVYRRFLK